MIFRIVFLIFIHYLCFLQFASSQISLNIGIFYKEQQKQANFKVLDTIIVLDSRSNNICRFYENSNLNIESDNGKVHLVKDNRSIGTYDTIYIQGVEPAKPYSFQRNGMNKPYKYIGKIKVYNSGEYLRFVNTVDLELYIAGVVAAEGGHKAGDEYYKVQAIIARTYALFNIKKHAKEGFHLCDHTHCQVYGGVCENKKIIQNVKSTEGIVITDSLNQLITATYHSNSGGETMNALDVWGKDFPYLKAVKDTFSLMYKNYIWEKTIDSAKWIRYFIEKYNFPVNDSSQFMKLFYFEQKQRKAFLDTLLRISLTQIRDDFGLKSSYFDILKDGNNIILKGKGFGHGVGLSQTGAMEMARIGFSYQEIIHFYYHNVQIKPLKETEFILPQ